WRWWKACCCWRWCSRPAGRRARGGRPSSARRGSVAVGPVEVVRRRHRVVVFLHDRGGHRARGRAVARRRQFGDGGFRGGHQLNAALVGYVLPMAVAERALKRIQQVEAGLEARALDAHECLQRTRFYEVFRRPQAHLAQPCGRLRPDVAHLERLGAHEPSDSTYTRAISSSPLWSSTSNRAGTGLSRSNTPTSAPSWCRGTTTSERDAASQAMWSATALTSSTRWVSPLRAAAPQTPRSSGMRTQAGWPWNGPTTSSVPS